MISFFVSNAMCEDMCIVTRLSICKFFNGFSINLLSKTPWSLKLNRCRIDRLKICMHVYVR